MIRRLLFAAAVVIAVTAVPASAGQVSIPTVSAYQYPYPYFFGFVYAYDSVSLLNADVHLRVTHQDGTVDVIVPDRQETINLSATGTYMLWKMFKYSTNVIHPGDTVTATITEPTQDGDT